MRGACFFSRRDEMAIEIEKLDTLYKGWNTFSIATIRLEGGQRITRMIEDHGRAACVLPYDPARRVALLVRQFRAPVYMKTGAPDLLEAVAGLIDEDDGAACARREAMEEAGLRLETLEPVASVWSIPGSSTEHIDMFLAPYGETDRVGAGGGLAHEHENIVVVELPLAELARMADAGGLADLKTLALVLTLRLRRPELFA